MTCGEEIASRRCAWAALVRNDIQSIKNKAAIVKQDLSKPKPNIKSLLTWP
jgi:hypothetical protein